MRTHLTLTGIVTLAIAPLLAMGAERQEIQQLRREMQTMKKRYDQQTQTLHDLERRVQGFESERSGSAETSRQTQSKILPRARTGVPAQATPGSAGTTGYAESTSPGGKEDAKVKKAPNPRSEETVVQQQHTLFDRRLTLEAGLTYTRSDRRQLQLSGFLALDAIFLGRINVDQVKADILTLDLTGRYGIGERWQVDLNVPFLYRSTTFQSGGQDSSGRALGETSVTLDPTLGDINFGVYYQLLKESVKWPDTVLSLRVKAPTGKDPFGIELIHPKSNDNLIVPLELPSGNGVWTFSPGISVVKVADPAVIFANFSYFYNLEGSFDDVTSDDITNNPGRVELPEQVVPGDVQLGNAYQYGLGLAFALNERMSLSFSYSQRFTEQTRIRQRNGPWQAIIGSDANTALLNTGLTYALTDRLSVVSNVGIGLTPDAPDLQFSLKLPFTF